MNAQNQSPWRIIKDTNASISGRNLGATVADKNIILQLDQVLLEKKLEAITNNSSKSASVEITFPNSRGILEKFLVWESSNFEPELQAKFPEIRAYAGVGITDNKASLNFSISPEGIQTMVLRANSGSEFIESYPANHSFYTILTSKNREKALLPLNCKTEDVLVNKQLFNRASKTAANDRSFRTLRLALSCTGEYAAYFGGTVAKALAAMNATMSRVNGVFNKDLAVKLSLIANNDVLIYTDASSDPYSEASIGVGGAWSQELQQNLTKVITNFGYDIGHLFGASGEGGNAGCIGCVCVPPTADLPDGKGSAYTSPGDGRPEGDTFDIDFVAHEMGHQLGANHTFSYELEGTGVNVEPGSGSTIMGYAGITNDYDVQANSDDYFSYASIQQIQKNLAIKTCPAVTPLTNSPPIVDAGLDYVIPKGTAFVLKGAGSDVNGDVLSYTWEQNDNATSTSGDNSIAVPTKPDGPLFRSLAPMASPVRYMPSFNNVLSNKLTSKWESVATVARSLHFVLTARDNAAQGTAQTNSDEAIITVSGTAGPFAVTSQNTDNISWFSGQSKTITWAVNNSNSLAGSANVNIKLSTDGGLTFPTILAANTPNDGSETITVPNVLAKNCRILIEPVANIFYAVNSKAFSIGYSVSSTCNTYTFAAGFAIPESATYTTRTITVPSATGTVSDVNFNVGFSHSFLSDLEMEVVSPLGTTVKLFDRSCGSRDSSLLLAYDDAGGDLACAATALQTIAPFQSLAAFNGENPQGTWTFRIRDAYKGDTGTLNSASIAICTQSFSLSTDDFKIDDFVLYPNPNKGNFSIQFTSSADSEIKVIVHDLLGRKLFEKEYAQQLNFNENISLNKSLQAGIYLLTVVDGNRKEVKKLVIQ
jgi:subtilisin-like proprotein convertase family protein